MIAKIDVNKMKFPINRELLKYILIFILTFVSCSEKETKTFDFELPNPLKNIIDLKTLKVNELIIIPSTSLDGLSYYSLFKIALKKEVLEVKYYAFQTEQLYRVQLIEREKSVTKFDVFSTSFTLKNPSKKNNFIELSETQLEKISKENYKNLLEKNKYLVITNQGVYQLNVELKTDFNSSTNYKFLDIKNLTQLIGYITERTSLIEELKFNVLINKNKSDYDKIRDIFLLYKSDSTFNTFSDRLKYKITNNTFCKPLSYDHWRFIDLK